MKGFPPEDLARTEAMCGAQHVCSQTRDVLLWMEAQAEQSGWDSEESAPTLFRVEAHPTRGVMHARLDAMFTTLLRQTCNLRTEGDVGSAMDCLATVMEQARGSLQNAGMPEQVDALNGSQPGLTFYGFALRVEAWGLSAETTDKAEMQATAEVGQLHQHPDRVELRYVQFVARDGLSWAVMRRRGAPVQAMVTRGQDDDTVINGRIANALGRMANAIAGNPVPVPSRAVFTK
jgi:hypothetical protein